MNRILLITLLLMVRLGWAQTPQWEGKFEQLDHLLPTPNAYRTGSGAPGPEYWQQRADYDISVELNDANQSISGSETITYHNNSPNDLRYLWLQLDQNIIADHNELNNTGTDRVVDSAAAKSFASEVSDFEGGFDIRAVTDASGTAIPYIINNTMMKITPPAPVKSGETYVFKISWAFNIVDRNIFRQRSGLEYFPKDDNYLYTIAQFFPRMCVYDDYNGWQNKQFLGTGEFALPFGDYKVKITVPADHVVAASGTLQNAREVLTPRQQERLEKAKTTFNKPVFIITEKEATANEKSRAREKKTWEFHADDVRDFAFVSSRKFIWDAMAVKIGDKTPLAMSLYPKEGNPLWEKESTLAVKNTLEVYSRMTFDYPYPVAISVHTASIGMEYPMICFNFGRPREDGSYSPLVRQGMIGVIVHEIGHNFFPMIVNSDERQTPWMDEGINSFIQLLTEMERYPDIQWTRGKPSAIVNYMKGNPAIQRPLMTNSEQVIQLGAEQYAKAATALYILRETVMGPELFDAAFKEYSQRWAFRHPMPADFFRTMEDASGVDLDWFWRGWFYTTDANDQTLEEVKWYRLDAGKSSPERKGAQGGRSATSDGSARERNTDFSDGPQPFRLTETEPRYYGEFRSRVDDKAIMSRLAGKNIYEITVSNSGGLVMPVVIEWRFKDGTREQETIPAEVWRLNEKRFTKVFIKDKEVVQVMLDPDMATADINIADNVFPKVERPSRFDQFRDNRN